MPRVALFGGSFNPPHVAHQLVALYVLETQAVDALWFVPTFVHPFGKPLAPYEDRIAMCELAAAALGPRVAISRAEHDLARRPEFVASRTFDLVELLRARHPEHAFRLVIGADILRETDKWYRWADLTALAPPLVIGRGGYAFHGAPAAGTETGVVMPEISATHVRELVADHDPRAAALLPHGILRYIADRGLYL
ncbi:MAG: nicotinate (nicotinamide) nucleotide adenylyltransferase [Kofleriaceae bacterium]